MRARRVWVGRVEEGGHDKEPDVWVVVVVEEGGHYESLIVCVGRVEGGHHTAPFSGFRVYAVFSWVFRVHEFFRFCFTSAFRQLEGF